MVLGLQICSVLDISHQVDPVRHVPIRQIPGVAGDQNPVGHTHRDASGGDRCHHHASLSDLLLAPQGVENVIAAFVPRGSWGDGSEGMKACMSFVLPLHKASSYSS